MLYPSCSDNLGYWSEKINKKHDIQDMIYSTIVNLLFIFLYVYCYQTPTLTFAQHVLSKGVTVYYPLTNAMIITVAALLLQMLVSSLAKLRGMAYSLTYVPSMLFVAFITSVKPVGNDNISMEKWVWGIPAILLIFMFLVRIIRQWQSVNVNKDKGNNVFVVNTLTSLVMMFCVCCAGNGDALFLKRIKAEKLMKDCDYNAIISQDYEGGEIMRKIGMERVGNKKDIVFEETDTTLSLIRYIALDKRGLLPEKLFTRPFTGSSQSVIFLENVKPYLFPKEFLSRRKSQDYYLCALLADADLDAFAKRLVATLHTDSIVCDSLPRHYREAMVAYQHLRSKPVVSYYDAVLETDYNDMRKILAMNISDQEKIFRLRETYGNTYWYYLYKKKH